MKSKEILGKALELTFDEKISVVDGILRSLDQPDITLDNIWKEEAEKRLIAYRSGKLKAISIEEVFQDIE